MGIWHNSKQWNLRGCFLRCFLALNMHASQRFAASFPGPCYVRRWFLQMQQPSCPWKAGQENSGEAYMWPWHHWITILTSSKPPGTFCKQNIALSSLFKPLLNGNFIAHCQKHSNWNLIKGSKQGIGLWPEQSLSESFAGIKVQIMDRVQ